MESPKTTAAISTTIPASSGAGVTLSSPDPCPCWKSHTSRPNVALRLSPLITTALIGSRIEPNARNISSSVAPASSPTISGNWSPIASRLSTLRAVTPPTRTWMPVGAGSARMSSTVWRADSLNESVLRSAAL